MLNKKILAVAVSTALLSTGAQAVIDLTDNTGALTVATETAGTDAVTITAADGTSLDMEADIGLNVPTNTTIYTRFDLTNATWGDAVIAGDLDTTNGGCADTNAGNRTVTLENGGATTDSFVVLSFVDTDDACTSTDEFSLEAVDDIDVGDADTAVTAQFRVWAGTNAALNAANALGTPNTDTTARTVISFSTGRSGDIADTPASEVEADVADNFTEWADVAGNANVTSVTLANVGNVDLVTIANSTVTTVVENDLSALEAVDVYDNNQTVSLTGDFSFGTWTLEDANNCGGAARALTIDTSTNATATAATADWTAAEWFLCVELDGTETVSKVTTPYTVTLDDDGLVATLGTIGYNSSTIEIDYITTFSDFTQRIYLVNTGNTAAAYSTTFTTESGVTATAGSGATGSIPAGEMVVVRATDLVTISGGTRTAAVIEVEAAAANIQATTQTVAADNGTDTVTLTVQ